MGDFLAVTAFRIGDVDPLTDAVAGFFRANGWPVERRADGAADDANDVRVYPPENGWTVVLWPQYFNIHDVPAAAFVSERLGVLTSTVHTYDGDYWVHTLIRDGEQLDRFASMPGYHLEDPTELPAFERAWAGNPQVVAEATGSPADQVAPYFVQVPVDSDEDLGMAFDNDEFDRNDIWVFVDLWRRLGITYPPDVNTPVASLRLAPDWLGKLPTGNESDL